MKTELANKQIDKRIAVEILKFKESVIIDSDDYEYISINDNFDSPFEFSPTSKIQDAWRVVEYLMQDEVYLQIYTNGMSGYEVVWFEDGLKIHSIKNSDICIAISLSAIEVIDSRQY